MDITSPIILRTLIAEAGRQADFYDRTNTDDERAKFWSDLEGLATDARRGYRALHISIREVPRIPIPIKACEQVEDLQNPHEERRLQA